MITPVAARAKGAKGSKRAPRPASKTREAAKSRETRIDDGAAPARPASETPDSSDRENAPRSDGQADTDEAEPVDPTEIFAPDDEDLDSDEDDSNELDLSERDSSSGTILDVGTMPTLPSLPSVDSRSSLPAVRARDGINRAGALERFLAEMGKYPLLTLEEEHELTKAYHERKDPVAARKLVVHNLRLVVKMAYKYRRAWANVLDLIQEGNVGLVEAVQRFDPFRGARFSTYATFWIRAYMLRYLLEHSRMVRISRTRVGRKLFFRLSKEREKLRAQGIEPGPKLLAERLGVGQSELEEVVRHMDQSEVRLDAPMYSEDASGGSVLDGMSGQTASPEAQTYRHEFEREVSSALDAFASTLEDPREQVAWKEHLMAEEPQSLSELGARFGVTKQRMGQIVAALRKRLKQHLIEVLGPDVQLGYNLDSE